MLVTQVERRDLPSAPRGAAPGLKALATSRVRLRTAEEAKLELEGVNVPADETELEGHRRLFLSAGDHTFAPPLTMDSGTIVYRRWSIVLPTRIEYAIT